jgi:hypothetical protein
LVITELGDNEDNEEGGDGGGSGGGGQLAGADVEVRALTTMFNALRRENIDLKNEIMLFKNSTNSLLKALNTSVQRIAQVPVLRVLRARSERNNVSGKVGGEETCNDDDGNSRGECNTISIHSDKIALATYMCFGKNGSLELDSKAI